MSHRIANLTATARLLEKMAHDLTEEGRIGKPDVARQVLLDAAVDLRDIVAELRAKEEVA